MGVVAMTTRVNRQLYVKVITKPEEKKKLGESQWA